MALSFENTAAAALGIWERWLGAAQSHAHRTASPSLLELQTICRETGISLPDLDSFARVRHLPPLFLCCSTDPDLAVHIATALGYDASWLEMPESPLILCLNPGTHTQARIRHGMTEQEVSRKALKSLLKTERQDEEFLAVEEQASGKATWSFCWIPFPRFLEMPSSSPLLIEFLLRQRAAVVVPDETPPTLCNTLKELNQKLWLTPLTEVNSPEDRKRLLIEVATVKDDGQDELDLRLSAAWQWLVTRLLGQIEQFRKEYNLSLSQHEGRIGIAHHLLDQYRANWIGGIRTLTESHLQNKSGSAFAQFLDQQKHGPQADTFVASLAMGALGNKIEEYLTDRMADLVGGLSGLAAKLELRRIALGDTNARWDTRQLAGRLEALLNEKKVFPEGGGKRGGIASNLTGKKQAILDERKAQLAKGVRLASQFYVTEFATWSLGVITSLENGINIQLTAALANRGLPDAEGLKAAQAGLNRLEVMLRDRHGGTAGPEQTVAEWFAAVCRARLIPLFHSS